MDKPVVKNFEETENAVKTGTVFGWSIYEPFSIHDLVTHKFLTKRYLTTRHGHVSTIHYRNVSNLPINLDGEVIQPGAWYSGY